MARIVFDVDVYTELNSDGIEVSLCDDSFTPQFQTSMSLLELAEKFYGFNEIPGTDGEMSLEGKREARKIISALEKTKKYLISKL